MQRGDLARRHRLNRGEALEQHVGGDVGGANIEAVGEFLEDLRLGQRTRVAGGALTGSPARVPLVSSRPPDPAARAGQFGVVLGGGDDLDLAHQRLDIGTLDEPSVSSRRPTRPAMTPLPWRTPC
jgi:hypothetical protein